MSQPMRRTSIPNSGTRPGCFGVNKSKKVTPSGRPASYRSDVRHEEGATAHPLSAIVFAETFTQELRPLTFDRPRVLLPIANTTLLDGTFDFLTQNDIRKILVVCASHAEDLERHIRNGPWGNSSEVHISVYSNPRCLSFGDALREIYMSADVSKQLTGDFLILFGDVVCNFRGVRHALAEHLAIRKQDPKVLMTILCGSDRRALSNAYRDVLQRTFHQRSVKECNEAFNTPLLDGMMYSPKASEGSSPFTQYSAFPRSEGDMMTHSSGTSQSQNVPLSGSLPFSSTISPFSAPGETCFVTPHNPFQHRPEEERLSLVIDPRTNIILKFSPHGGPGNCDSPRSGGGVRERPSVRIDLDATIITKDFDTVSVRSDLIDHQIYLCSHEMLQVFKEGFDFKTMTDCMESTLDDEILGNKFSVYVLPDDCYCRRVRSVHHYLYVHDSVVRGWAHPMRPGGAQSHAYNVYPPTHRYVHPTATLRDEVERCLGPSSILGENTVLMHGVVVRGSTLGASVTVAAGSRLEYCIVWDETTIGEGCTLSYCVIGAHCVIGDGCYLPPGSVLSSYVVLSPHTHLVEHGIRLTAYDPQTGRRIEASESDPEWIGDHGYGVLYSDGCRPLSKKDIPLTSSTSCRSSSWYPISPSRSLPIVGSLTNLVEACLACEEYIDTVEYDDDENDDEHAGEPQGGRAVSVKKGSVSQHKKLDDWSTFRNEVIDTVITALSDGHENVDTAVTLSSTRLQFNRTPRECGQCILSGLVAYSRQEQPTDAKACHKIFKESVKKLRSLLQEDRFGHSEDATGYDRALTLLAELHDAPHLHMRAGFFLKTLYDFDVIAEEGIFRIENEMQKAGASCRHDETAVAMWKACSEFVEALRDADEEDA